MDTMLYTCPDCGTTVSMDTRHFTSAEYERLDKIFEQWLIGCEWQRVKFGFFNMSRKWVCKHCKQKYIE